MDIIKLIIIFIGIIFFIKLKKPLFISILAGIIITIILYKIPITKSLALATKSATSKETIYLVLAFYSITYIQRMLENRGHLLLAEKSLDNLFNSKRINAMIAPFIIGLLPSAGAVLIAAPIVKNAAKNSLDSTEQAFTTSYYRHISECFLPTYSSIILALDLSGVDMRWFVLGMLPLIFALFMLGYIFYIKKIPLSNTKPNKAKRKNEIINLIISLWPIASVIIIILSFKIPVFMAVIPIILLSIFINKFSIDELIPMIKSAFETKLIANTVLIMVFKEIISHSGVIGRLPEYFAKLPIPPVMIFALIFFIGTIVAGSQAIIGLVIPLAFLTIPNGGVPLLILFMSISYIAMQISPTHICLAIVTEDFEISFIDLVKKTLPIVFIFSIIVFIYYWGLSLII
ncbi:DUF401 family protein [Fusobacterium sp. PH5-44]|uniref:DUF401 family protein n=1 Tax=unclassified Fusobacterium TaxID=2648384 RepID=UPI003D1AE6E0